MPLTINVGLSRKTSENYNSTGTSIHLTAELDQALLTRPGELQDRIERLYHEAESALDRQGGAAVTPPAKDRVQRGDRPKPATMTQSQQRAIEAIARRLEIDPSDECQHEFGLDYAGLSVRDASKLIDHLKALQPARNGGGR